MLAIVYDEIRRDPSSARQTAVIVDEAQDLAFVGMRLLHALVGETNDEVLLRAASRGSGEVVSEKRQLAHAQLFVAMTRARDTLWLGSVAPAE